MSAEAAALDFDREVARAGVERIFDQLLDRGGRPLDDFAGRNLAGHLLGQDVNYVLRHSSQ